MENIFNLENAIATWRNSRDHNRKFSEEDLDELERYVRDQVKALSSGGKSEAEAFLIAIK